ncbi:isochorismate synthase [Pimelobacter simplex]|uniref:isochorismate synthase n=1 Tax=Nocardioides simplex TaxID=2045 RepID=A0A0C5XCX7_NOCSI|nr:isochorismate synthase [Pimelobacter simplex]AJR18664.1 Isochorismate synthase of siderophore biosynthesis [Pimelobacter simplex]MCG8153152.1 isochorismate synthase [Pimelobacter simplex]GEB14305.1 isochorismate synthase DhbC [Pimelobacter simplex]SFM31261.1 isochorismate synthase [Pimelobacter simplex]
MARDPITPAALATRPMLFASGEEAYVASAVRRTVETPDGADPAWADGVVAALEPGERALCALSFAAGAPALAHLVVGSEHALQRPPHDASVQRTYEVTEFPTADAYAGMVEAALAKIATGALHKVVLGRCLDVVSTPPLVPAEIIDRLLTTRPGRYVFSVPLVPGTDAGPPSDGPILVGASPELLVRREGLSISCTPLAGSVPRSADPDEDARRAEGLRQSAKDLAEHAFVVEAIVHALKEVCVEIEYPATPELLSTDTVWHLATPIRARLADGVDGPSALRLAQLLHPTPAVGGVPTAAANAVIADLEGDLRDWFAGCVGWVDGRGDGEFAVTIRAAVMDGPRLRLFAGAGIVAGSEPASEVRETGAKLATMARVTGLP